MSNNDQYKFHDAGEHEHPIRWREKGIRFINQKMLEPITFNDEPVVPKILRESTDPPYFYVEKVGIGLGEVLNDSNLSTKLGLKLLLHITNQLKEIDKDGFVLFDRGGENIRVLQCDENKISVRQTDLEDLYDKNSSALYSSANSSVSEENLQTWEDIGVSPWIDTVDSIARAGIGFVNRNSRPDLSKALLTCISNNPKVDGKNATLEFLESSLEKSLSLLM